MAFLSGHGVTLEMEKVGDPSGTFTTVPQINAELGHMRERDETVVEVHELGVPVKVLSNVQKVADINFNGVYDEDLDTHDDTTGLGAQFLGIGGTPGRANLFGIRMRGPNSSGAGNDEIIASGYIKSFKIGYPTGAGTKVLEAVFTVSGAYIINGTSYT